MKQDYDRATSLKKKLFMTEVFSWPKKSVKHQVKNKIQDTCTYLVPQLANFEWKQQITSSLTLSLTLYSYLVAGF